MEPWWVFHLLLGLGLSQTIIVHWSLPDPPPYVWLIRTSAGGIGGVIGATLAIHSSDPMPGVWAALAGSAFLGGIVNAFVKTGARAQ